MSSYSGGFGGGGGGGVDYGASQEKGRMMEQVRSQIAVANLQEMIVVSDVACCPSPCQYTLRTFQKMSDKCFRKCVGSPSTTLDSREQVHTLLYMSP